MVDFTGGTWRSLIDGSEVSAIPDSGVLIDNFEDDDGDPIFHDGDGNEIAGPYGDGDSLSDFYSGNVGDFSRVSSDVLEGGNALQKDKDSSDDDGIYSLDGDGLPYYPEPGDVFACLLRDDSDRHIPYFCWGVQDDPREGYVAAIDEGGDEGFRLGILEDDESSVDYKETTSQSIVAGDWYDVELEWGTDGEIIATLYSIDEDEFDPEDPPSDWRESEESTLSFSDTNFEDNRGIQFSSAIGRSSTTLTGFDYYRKTGEL